MQKSILEAVKSRDLLLKIAPIAAFAVPLFWLYALEPATFELMWKGRTFELFFIWLIGLELILGWDDLKGSKIGKFSSPRTVAFAVALVLPTVYVLISFFGGLNGALYDWASQSGVTWADSIPLSTEYLVFAAMFAAVVFLAYGFGGIKAFSVPAFFLLIVGAIYTIDNVFPYGQFTPFQIFVPTTTALAAALLNLMGYSTNITYMQSAEQGTMPHLTAVNPATGAQATFSIAWPCAGIESFLIFTVVTLLFLKRMRLSLKGKIGYFAFGAAVTYIINAFRIVNIFQTGMVFGETSQQVVDIHLYYGPLYAVAWIVSFPLIILLSQALWQKLRKPKSTVTPLQPLERNLV